jgi:hypothetical protein
MDDNYSTQSDQDLKNSSDDNNLTSVTAANDGNPGYVASGDLTLEGNREAEVYGVDDADSTASEEPVDATGYNDDLTETFVKGGREVEGRNIGDVDDPSEV